MSQEFSTPGIVGYVPNHYVAIGTVVSPFVVQGIAPGVAGTVFGSNGASSDPSFQTIGALGAVTTVTGNTGGPEVPDGSGNFNILGTTNQVRVAGTTNTETISLIGPYTPATYTAHGVLIGEGTSSIVAATVGTNGQVLLGSSAADPLFGTLTSSDSSVSFTPGAGSLSLQVTGGSTTIKTITGDSGGSQSPSSGNFNILGTGSITSVGTAATETIQLTGLTNHAVLVGAGNATITKVGPGATTGSVLQNNSGADPTYSTASYPSTATGTGSILRADGTNWSATTSTYPNTNAVSTLLYASASNVMSALATANNGTLVTSNAGVPSILAGPGTTGNILQSNSAAAPSFSTATYPSTTTANQILFSSATNTVGGDADLTYSATTDTLSTSNASLKGPTPWADVIAWGADPTGSADSTTAITNALGALSAGGTVFFPKGTYKITSTITIAKHARLVGASRTDCIITMATATGDMFLVNEWYVGFENLTLTAATNFRSSGFAINIAATYNYDYVWRCDIYNQWKGVNMAGHLCYVDDCNFRTFSNVTANGSWIELSGSFDRWISKVVGDNGSNLTGFAGIRLLQTASLLLRDCSLVRSTTCMSIEPGAGLVVPSVYCVNTFFDSSTFGVTFAGNATGTIQRIKFTQCWFSTHGTAGVFFNQANTQGVDFCNCDFYQNVNGIDATAATDWTVIGSRFAGNTTTAIKTTAAAGHSFRITDSTIGNTAGFGNNQAAFNIQAGTYNYYKISGNTGINNNTVPGIVDNGSVTGQGQKDVSNNFGSTQVGGIAATIAASAAINTVETIVAGGLNNAVIPANSLQVGTTIAITVQGTCTATVANLSTFTLRMGTAGTVAGDASVAIAAVTSAAAGTGIGFKVVIIFTVRTIGATGTIAGSAEISNTGITGISTNNSNVIPLTATATLNTTTANYMELTYKSAAATTTCTFQNGIVEIIKC